MRWGWLLPPLRDLGQISKCWAGTVTIMGVGASGYCHVVPALWQELR